jgi:hypothetical protein
MMVPSAIACPHSTSVADLGFFAGLSQFATFPQTLKEVDRLGESGASGEVIATEGVEARIGSLNFCDAGPILVAISQCAAFCQTFESFIMMALIKLNYC